MHIYFFLAISCDCQREHTEWDKLFIMLENSQMKENMLVQSFDEIIKVELQTLRETMLQLAENLAGTCSTSLGKATSLISSQMDQILTKSSKEVQDLSRILHELEQGKLLREILQLSQNMSIRLRHLEDSWQRNMEIEAQRMGLPQKDRTGYATRGDNFILNSLWQELQETKAKLKESQTRTMSRFLPAGKLSSLGNC